MVVSASAQSEELAHWIRLGTLPKFANEIQPELQTHNFRGGRGVYYNTIIFYTSLTVNLKATPCKSI